MAQSVTTIILTWNSADFIAECLDSVLASSYPTNIVVVDNDSSDKTRDIVAAKYPSVALHNSGSNLGYAGGNNIGVQLAREQGADYMLVLNPDTAIDAAAIGTMVARLDAEPALAAVSPKIYHYKTTKLWYAGSNINWRTGNTHQFNGNDVGQFDDEQYTQRLSGCAMLLRASAVAKVGLMDERFFLFYEESDWSVNFTKAGYSLGLAVSAIVWHKASSSTGGYVSPLYQYYMTRNRLLFIQKHRPSSLLPTLLMSLYDSGISVAVATRRQGIRRGLHIGRAILYGYTDFALRRFGYRNIY